MSLYHSLLLFFLVAPGRANAATEASGRIFYAGPNSQTPALSYYFLSRETEKGERREATNTYFDFKGKELVEEKSFFEKNQLVKYTYQERQVNESGEAVVKNGKLLITFTSENKTETDSETYDPTTIVASMIGRLLNERWDSLMKGESIKVRYLAIDRLETVGFKFFKDEERLIRGRPVVDIVMKPSSIFISALVSPIRISLSKAAPHWIVETNGRTPIRVALKNPPEKRSDWKAIDALVQYDPPKEVPEAGTTPAPAVVPAKPVKK